MKKIIIDEKYSKKRIDKVIIEIYKNLPVSFLYKAFRKKDIKINGKRVKENEIVYKGDIVEIYITDEILSGSRDIKNNIESLDKIVEKLDIVYEDENILIVNKKQGIPVQPDIDTPHNTLIDMARKYIRLNEKNKKDNSDFEPSLCHRLDRNTGGLVVIAKNRESHEIILNKFKNNKIKKYYLCIVKGIINKKQDVLKAFLFKDASKSLVYISETMGKGKLSIETKYKVLDYIYLEDDIDLTYLEVELVTGRTHQIRAHMAYIGHPIVGDGKYGINLFNKKLNIKQQLLWEYKLNFENDENAGKLKYLNGKIFQVEHKFKIINGKY